MPKNEAAPILPVEPAAPVDPIAQDAPGEPAPVESEGEPVPPTEPEGDEETAGSDFRVLALIPVEGEEGAYTARIFMNRTDVKKNLKLDNLPDGILFYRGKRLLPKVQTVVTL